MFDHGGMKPACTVSITLRAYNSGGLWGPAIRFIHVAATIPRIPAATLIVTSPAENRDDVEVLGYGSSRYRGSWGFLCGRFLDEPARGTSQADYRGAE